MKKAINLLIILCLMLSLCGCSSTQNPDLKVSKTDFYFDTVITITLYGTSDSSIIDDCFTLAQNYEDIFSATKENSDIYCINQNAGITAVTVDPETIALLQKGLYYEELSNHQFSIACGALSSRWNISEITNQLDESHQGSADMIVPQGEIDEILSSFNRDHSIIIDETNSTVFLPNPNVQLDLGAIAKGYIADQMRTYLQGKGVKTGVISLGGNILTIGPKENAATYNIGITKPFSPSGELIGGIALEDGSVVTSGNYERFFVYDNKIYHHILDLNTGYPVDNELTSVTIISKSSCDGDALSTICYIYGLEKGMELIESLDDVEAIFITNDRQLHFSSGFDKDITFTKERT